MRHLDSRSAGEKYFSPLTRTCRFWQLVELVTVTEFCSFCSPLKFPAGSLGDQRPFALGSRARSGEATHTRARAQAAFHARAKLENISSSGACNHRRGSQLVTPRTGLAIAQRRRYRRNNAASDPPPRSEPIRPDHIRGRSPDLVTQSA